MWCRLFDMYYGLWKWLSLWFIRHYGFEYGFLSGNLGNETNLNLHVYWIYICAYCIICHILLHICGGCIIIDDIDIKSEPYMLYHMVCHICDVSNQAAVLVNNRDRYWSWYLFCYYEYLELQPWFDKQVIFVPFLLICAPCWFGIHKPPAWIAKTPGSTSIRHFHIRSMSNRCRSDGLCSLD